MAVTGVKKMVMLAGGLNGEVHHEVTQRKTDLGPGYVKKFSYIRGGWGKRQWMGV